MKTPKSPLFVIFCKISIFAIGLSPAILVGVLSTYLTVSDWIQTKSSENWWDKFPEPPIYDKSKLLAAVVVSNKGTESTDLLASYEILGSSGAFNVFTVAPERLVSPIWQGVDLLPHYTFEEFENRFGESPDIILIPNILDPKNPTIVDWVKRHAKEETLVVSVCEGVRVLAEAGLLIGRKASSHFLSLGQLEGDYPDIDWTRGVRYVEDNNFITSAGVTASIDATFQVLHRVAGIKVAQETAQKLNYSLDLHPREVELFNIGLLDYASLFVTGGYIFNKPASAVLVYEGIGETDLASILDLYPRVFDGSVGSIASKRSVFRSKNGLDLIPWWSFEEKKDIDNLIIPGEFSLSNINDPTLSDISSGQITVNHPHVEGEDSSKGKRDSFAYDSVVKNIAIKRSNSVARAVAKWVEYPTGHIQLTGASWPYSISIIPIGLLGLGVVFSMWLNRNIFS